ncbi:MAG: hypothetical protein HOQ01_02615 [Lysobacter sp.]|nr:hypothetical protein [Lysobacter sp.]
MLHVPLPRQRIAWSCVLDDTPALWAAFVPWLATALGPGGVAVEDLVVHHAAPLRHDVEALCGNLGVRTLAVPPFDARSPHCNKLRQLDTDFGDAERVVLMDVDTVFAARLPIETVRAPVAGKLVDAANPPLRVLQRVFGAAGVPLPQVCTTALRDADNGMARFDTLAGHFDGGVYIVDARALRESLGPRWTYWARWLLDRAGILERWRVHVDQVAFCLALAETGLHADIVPGAWNVPTHVRAAHVDDAPIVLHHHGRLDAHMRLDGELVPAAAPAVARVNAAIDAFTRAMFDNRTFWNHRYAAHPALGSGPGSRGEALVQKRAWLSALVALAPGASVLDWGCGDLEAVRTLSCTDVTGVDIAIEALRVARTKRGDWRFLTPAQFDALDGRPRDFVLCLDVLVHQRTADEYAHLLHRLAPLAHLGLIVAGYDAEPNPRSHIHYFHEPLRTTLAAMPWILEAVPLMETRDTTLYFAATSEAGRALAYNALEKSRAA